MVGKIYSQLEYLTAEQAASYLCFLIDVRTDSALDVLIDYTDQSIIDFYCDFLGAEIALNDIAFGGDMLNVPIYPIGYQRHLRGLKLNREVSGGQGERYSLAVGRVGICYFSLRDAVFNGEYLETTEGSVLKHHKAAEWRAMDIDLYELFPRGINLAFLRADIETLAAKINGEPDITDLKKRVADLTAALERVQIDNARLIHKSESRERSEEMEALKAEVERLQAENTELKEEVGRLQADSKNGAVLFGHESENLRLVEWAINEFYHPDKFDVNDPKTHPKQEYMLAEIMRVHGVTGVTAKAVERIATPFSRDRAKK